MSRIVCFFLILHRKSCLFFSPVFFRITVRREQHMCSPSYKNIFFLSLVFREKENIFWNRIFLTARIIFIIIYLSKKKKYDEIFYFFLLNKNKHFWKKHTHRVAFFFSFFTILMSHLCSFSSLLCLILRVIRAKRISHFRQK